MRSLKVSNLEPTGSTRPLKSTASAFFYLPFDEDEDKAIETYKRQFITWKEEPPGSFDQHHDKSILNDVLSYDDLYLVLGIPQSSNLDKAALRRAYLSRSRACHPE